MLVTVLPPANKTFKQLLVNEKAVQAMQDGLIYKYSFKLTENTTVRVEYDDAAYDKEI